MNSLPQQGSSSSSQCFPTEEFPPMFETIDHGAFFSGIGEEIGCYFKNFPHGICNSNVTEPLKVSDPLQNANATSCMQYSVQVRDTVLKKDGLEAFEHHGKQLGSVLSRIHHRLEKKRQRMIKNRESAARSRARKLAYEAQQRIEIMKYKKENEQLRKSIQVVLAMGKMKRGKKSTMKRTSSGPL